MIAPGTIGLEPRSTRDVAADGCGCLSMGYAIALLALLLLNVLRSVAV